MQKASCACLFRSVDRLFFPVSLSFFLNKRDASRCSRALRRRRTISETAHSNFPLRTHTHRGQSIVWRAALSSSQLAFGNKPSSCSLYWKLMCAQRQKDWVKEIKVAGGINQNRIRAGTPDLWSAGDSRPCIYILGLTKCVQRCRCRTSPALTGCTPNLHCGERAVFDYSADT